ncbi:transposase, partial [Photobacterium phosphoreum]
LMQVMKEHDDNRKLGNIVQLDDAYIGGKQKGKRGRGAEGKTPFVSAISLNEEGHPIYMRLSVVSCFKKQEITDWAKKHLKEKTLVISDGLPCFNGLVAADIIHGSLPKNGKELHQYEAAFYWVDTMIGNVKNSIKGTYHAIREKHIPRYLGEFCFRFNYRFRVE